MTRRIVLRNYHAEYVVHAQYLDPFIGQAFFSGGCYFPYGYRKDRAEMFRSALARFQERVWEMFPAPE